MGCASSVQTKKESAGQPASQGEEPRPAPEQTVAAVPGHVAEESAPDLEKAALVAERELDAAKAALAARPATLAQWYMTQYKQGGKFTLSGYLLDLPLNAFYHQGTGVRIWREVIDISGDSADSIILFHYTGFTAFSAITHTGNNASEIRASLVTEGEGANAWYGKGAYTTQNAPDMWGPGDQKDILMRIIDNNYRRMLQRDALKMGVDEAFEMYKERVKYCIPLLVARENSYNVAERCTPEMQECGHGPGKNIRGQDLNEEGCALRDCWVVRLTNDDADIQAASAKLVDILRSRYKLSAAIHGSDDIDTVHCASRLAYVLRDRSLLKEAAELYHVVLAGYEKHLGPEALDVMTCQGNLALALKELGNLKEAEELYRRSIALHVKVEGEDARTTRVVKSNLACMLRAKGEKEEALRLYKEALEGDEKEFGKDHPTTLISINNYAGLLKDEKKYDEAEPLLRRALEGLIASLGARHSRTLICQSNLSGCLRKLGRLDEAVVLYEDALKGHEEWLGAEHMSTLTDCSNLAGCLEDMGKLQEAEPYYRRAYEGFAKTLGPTHGNTLIVVNNLGLLCSKLEKNLDAEKFYRIALAGLEQIHGGTTHPQAINAACNLAALLAWNKEFDLAQRKEALELYRRCEVSFRERFGPDDEDTKDCIECITDLEADIKKEENPEPADKQPAPADNQPAPADIAV